MTMPAIVPALVPAIGVTAPNAATPAGGAQASADGTVAAQFNAVLTMLLGAQPAAAPTLKAETPLATDVSDADSTTSEAGEESASSVVAPMMQASAPAIASLSGNANGTQGMPPDMSSLEAGADAAIGGMMESQTNEPTDSVAIDASIAATLASTTSAASLAGSIAPNDTTTARRGLDLLAPDFRDRLDRVIDRMETEFGYKVEVTETFRSQARQDALYAQGRTEPGQVVTWTRASNHTLGRAADLVVDGSFDDALPYERLMRIAREEGLRTLGPRDPGHVELPSSSAVASARGSADSLPALSQDGRGAVIARPAPSIASHSSIVPGAQELESPNADAAAQPPGVARVAQVAHVARVARVAQVAMVGAQTAPVVHASAPRATRGAETSRSGPARSPVGKTAPAAVGATNQNASPLTAIAAGGQTSTSTTTSDGETAGEPNADSRKRVRIDPAAARDSAAEVLRQSRDELVRAVAGTDPSVSTTSTTAAGETSSIGHADMSERIARLLKVQDAAADRPMSQVMLRLERPDGGEDKVRVDLRGNSVSATLDLGDQGAADRLGANMKELQRALERHGFETDSLTVRTATRAVESSTLSRAAGASVEAELQRAASPSSSNTSTNTSSRERGARHDEQRPSPDSQQRHRSRREQKGDR
jgi:hypothetical protein